MERIFCRVDETGQDTQGKLFIVGIVNVVNLEQATSLAEQLEKRLLGRQRNKGLRKWTQPKNEEQVAYARILITLTFFKGSLFYRVYRDINDYPQRTVEATAEAIKAYLDTRAPKVDVRVDGLTERECKAYAVSLRKAKLRTDKIRGGDDRSDALLRLADALCGWVRAAQTKTEFAELLRRAEQDGFVIRLGK
jgi:hypothetical protein